MILIFELEIPNGLEPDTGAMIIKTHLEALDKQILGQVAKLEVDGELITTAGVKIFRPE